MLWNNTSLILVASVGISLAVVVISWVIGRPSSLQSKNTHSKDKEFVEEYEESKEDIDQEKEVVLLLSSLFFFLISNKQAVFTTDSYIKCTSGMYPLHKVRIDH